MTRVDTVDSPLRMSMQLNWSSDGQDLPEAEFGLLEALHPVIRGHMQIGRVWDGRSGLESSETVARNTAATLFSLSPELLNLEKIHDALGEVTNTLRGSLKNLLPGPVHLALPIAGKLFGTEAPWFDVRLTTGVGLWRWNEPFRVQILRKT
jgi:hypothetical protein